LKFLRSLSEALAIHALNHQPVGELAEHAARQGVVERRGRAIASVELLAIGCVVPLGDAAGPIDEPPARSTDPPLFRGQLREGPSAPLT
jgi:hypothetical protein